MPGPTFKNLSVQAVTLVPLFVYLVPPACFDKIRITVPKATVPVIFLCFVISDLFMYVLAAVPSSRADTSSKDALTRDTGSPFSRVENAKCQNGFARNKVSRRM